MPLIPEPILKRIEEFSTMGKTGKVTLNVYQGSIVSADLNEHIKADKKNSVDKSSKPP